MENIKCYLIVILLSLSFHASACEVTLASYGAVGGDGPLASHDMSAIKTAFETKCVNESEQKIIDGENKTYLVYGSLEIRSDINVTLKNIRLIQKAPESDTRTISKYGGTLNLYNVSVDRGSNEKAGSLENSAGIWLEVTDSKFDGVEVTGSGIGQGLFILNSHNIEMNNVYVHDMRWQTVTPPQYEQLTGIRIQNSDFITLINSRVQRLYGNPGNGVYSRYQTDGITINHSNGMKIINSSVEKTGEGIDFTGGGGNINFEVADTALFDIHSFGFKFANTTSNGVIRDSSVYRAGYAGFVFSASVGGKLPGALDTQNILVDNCKAFYTGYGGDWSQQNVSGFLVLKAFAGDIYPKNIHIKNSAAITDSNSQYPMKYGFLSQTEGNTLYNTDSVGHLWQGNLGFELGAP